MKAINMKSQRGNPVPNQFIIEHGNKTYFQSYRTIIAVKDWKTGEITLDWARWDYSRTTSKYLSIFLNETKAETQLNINSGSYALKNLNKLRHRI